MPLNQERDERIKYLRFKKRWTERRIAAEVDMSPAGVHWICRRLAGHPRDQAQYSDCDGCGEPTKHSQLNASSLCEGCR